MINENNLRAVGIEPETTLAEMVISRTGKLKKFAVGVTIAGLLLSGSVGTALGYTFADDDITGIDVDFDSTAQDVLSRSKADRGQQLNPAYALGTGHLTDETEAEILVNMARKVKLEEEGRRKTPWPEREAKYVSDIFSFFSMAERIFEVDEKMAEEYLRAGAEDLAIKKALHYSEMTAGEKAYIDILRDKKTLRNIKTTDAATQRYIDNFDYLILSVEELDYQVVEDERKRAAGMTNENNRNASIIRPFNLRQSELDRLKRVEQGLEPMFPEIKPNEYVLIETEKFIKKYKPQNMILTQSSALPQRAIDNNKPLSERIFVHQKRVQFDVPPVIESGRTLVPIRMVAQELGAEVEWLNETQEVIIMKDGKRIVLTLGSKDVTVDGVISTIDVPAKAVNGRTLVPIRFISENMSIPVEYIETTQEVHIGEDNE